MEFDIYYFISRLTLFFPVLAIIILICSIINYILKKKKITTCVNEDMNYIAKIKKAKTTMIVAIILATIMVCLFIISGMVMFTMK